MDCVIWRSKKLSGDYASLGMLQPEDEGRLIHAGTSVADRFSKEAFFRMLEAEKDDEVPKSETLAHCAYTLSGHMVISKDIQDLLKKANVPHIELLPVRILDRKGQGASSQYAIVNALTVLDLIDQKRSALDWNTLDPEMIASCEKLILKEPPPSGTSLFRLKHFSRRLVMDNALVDRLKLRGFSGAKFTNLEEFDGF